MRQYMQFAKRNILLYVRDRQTVFFSLLSMAVILCLMLLFLGDINIGALTDALTKLPGRNAADDRQNARLLILGWTTGGILPVNAVMVALSAFSTMVKDKNSRRLDAICTCPIKQQTIALAYISAAGILAAAICTLTFCIAEIYMIAQGAAVLSAGAHAKIFIMICINSFTYSAIMYAGASAVKSEGAWSGFGTVIGALVGFLGGIYLPIGQLAPAIQAVLKCTPVIYSTTMFRQIICADIMEALFRKVPTQVTKTYQETMGITICCFGQNISAPACAAVLAAFGVFCLTAGLLTDHLRKMKAK